ncbi:MAG: hypothetical protein IJE84_04410 [Clostridia bacterium]|nr:hypothetical protein [Clostridia bacterium]
MSNFDRALKIAKTTLIGGYAVSLLLPYRVERQGDETTYHAPLYKLAYKKHVDDDEKNVHTYTVTSFGLLSDQISTAKRLYTATLLKKPYYKERAARKVTRARDKVGSAVAYARRGARGTIDVTTLRIKKAKESISSLDDMLVKFVEDIID